LESASKILIVDDDDSIRTACTSLLRLQGFDVFPTDSPTRALQILDNQKFDICFVDFKMPEMNGIEFIKRLKKNHPDIDVVMITGYATIEMAVEAIRQGAYDYIPKPFKAEKLLAVVDKLVEKNKILSQSKEQELILEFNGKPLNIIGKSPKMQELFRMIKRVAPTDSTVLILGESGTGKELIARAIHANSARKDKPFYTMDCGSVVETLFESELFGYEKGAFTDAVATKQGAFEMAHEGTFFFDEIGNISVNLQAKILRAMQEKEIRRIGGTQVISVDVRIIAATNLDLRRAVEEGSFREDLYYRLSVIPIRLPPLRERKDDIPLLVEHFLQKHQLRGEKKIHGISEEALSALMQYDWPGNIRELENVVERAIIIEEGDRLSLSSLPSQIKMQQELQKKGPESIPTLAEIEKQHIQQVLKITNRNISRAARILGIDRKTLYDKIRRYHLE